MMSQIKFLGLKQGSPLYNYRRTRYRHKLRGTTQNIQSKTNLGKLISQIDPNGNRPRDIIIQHPQYKASGHRCWRTETELFSSAVKTHENGRIARTSYPLTRNHIYVQQENNTLTSFIITPKMKLVSYIQICLNFHMLVSKRQWRDWCHVTGHRPPDAVTWTATSDIIPIPVVIIRFASENNNPYRIESNKNNSNWYSKMAAYFEVISNL